VSWPHDIADSICLFVFGCCWLVASQICELPRILWKFELIQGQSRSSILVSIESTHATSY